jgi:hypothetical protein
VAPCDPGDEATAAKEACCGVSALEPKIIGASRTCRRPGGELCDAAAAPNGEFSVAPLPLPSAASTPNAPGGLAAVAEPNGDAAPEDLVLAPNPPAGVVAGGFGSGASVVSDPKAAGVAIDAGAEAPNADDEAPANAPEEDEAPANAPDDALVAAPSAPDDALIAAPSAPSLAAAVLAPNPNPPAGVVAAASGAGAADFPAAWSRSSWSASCALAYPAFALARNAAENPPEVAAGAEAAAEEAAPLDAAAAAKGDADAEDTAGARENADAGFASAEEDAAEEDADVPEPNAGAAVNAAAAGFSLLFSSSSRASPPPVISFPPPLGRRTRTRLTRRSSFPETGTRARARRRR